MPLTEETKVVGRCDDGCNGVRFGSKTQPPVGFYATIEEVYEDSDGTVMSRTVRVYATSLAHLKRAGEEQLADGSKAEQRVYSADGSGDDRPEHTPAGEQAEDVTAA